MLLLLVTGAMVGIACFFVVVAIPYSSGMLLLLHEVLAPYTRTTLGRNPLFIGNAFATQDEAIWSPKNTVSQSPIHRECFCYNSDLFAGPDAAPSHVAIPYSSGMLLLPSSMPGASVPCRGEVAIPYSSGMFLLLHASVGGNRGLWGRRNPLFIGNAFATGRGRGHDQDTATGLRRNPLFIGNAFATSATYQDLIEIAEH